MTDLLLKRMVFTNKSTIGELFMNGLLEAFTLEDAIRKQKIPGKTAIPKGRYEVIINFSNRFKELMPLLLGVPGFTGVRIHPGNTEADTTGCVLIGKEKYSDGIGKSRLAFDEFFPKLEAALKTGKVFINIIGGND